MPYYLKVAKTSLDREEEISNYRYFRWRKRVATESRAQRISKLLERVSIARGIPCPNHGNEHSAMVVHGADIDTLSPSDKDAFICPRLYMIWRMIDALAKGVRLEYEERYRDRIFVPIDK